MSLRRVPSALIAHPSRLRASNTEVSAAIREYDQDLEASIGPKRRRYPVDMGVVVDGALVTATSLQVIMNKTVILGRVLWVHRDTTHYLYFRLERKGRDWQSTKIALGEKDEDQEEVLSYMTP